MAPLLEADGRDRTSHHTPNQVGEVLLRDVVMLGGASNDGQKHGALR
ncbi:MAG: hypothetical protein ABTQ32_28970 [Myxococcaceae bacterium]